MKLDALINEYYDKLNENDRYIWKMINTNKQSCAKMTVNELADFCNVSRTTILRFARKIGLEGFSELKLFLKWETQGPTKAQENVTEIISEGYIHAINELQKKDFSAICQLMHQSKRLFIFGSGDIQNQAAKHLKQNFLSCGDCVYDLDTNQIHDEFFKIVTAEDVVILLSLDGESTHVVNAAKQLTFLGVKVISISKLKNSTLARISTENIYFTTSIVNLANLSGKTYESTAMLFVIVELLFVKYNLFKNALSKDPFP